MALARSRSFGPGLIASGVLVVLIAAMALDTKVVRIGAAGSAADAGVFSPAAYGAATFPKVQALIEKRAVDAVTLAGAIGADQAAAASRYGVDAIGGPVFSVSFTGTVGKPDFGVYAVAVPGLPPSIHLTVQTGPAILGTARRDATGTITFGQFQNQIEYQNAGSALNKAMKKAVLAKVDTANLTGKTIAVTGAFQLTDPTAWVVTPAELVVR